MRPPVVPGDPPGVAYSRAERAADAVIHVCGIVLALMAAPALIVAAALLDGTAPVVASVVVYGAALLAMICASAAYHLIPTRRWREVLRRLDHAAIYLKIAATQTPFAVLIGGASWWLAPLWTAALGGAAGKLLFPGRLGRLSVPLYLGLGWCGLAVMWPGEGGVALAGPTLILAATGGGLYTLGVVFFVAERLRFHNAIWHGFVLAATGVFYAAVATELGLRAA